MNNKIVFIGEERVGKSRVIAEFCKEEQLILDNFVGPGKGFTKINVEFYLEKNRDKVGKIIFESKESVLNKFEQEFTEDGVITFMNKINNDTLRIGGAKRELDPKNDTIRIVTSASELACEIMGGKFESLTIVDTPGVSGEVEGLNNVQDANVYVLMMRTTNEGYLEKTINKMASTIGGAGVLFCYNIQAGIDYVDQYEKMKEMAKNGIRAFTEVLRGLRPEKTIIDSSIEFLNPEATVVAIPSLSIDCRDNFAEIQFKKEFTKAIKNKLENKELSYIENIIKEILLRTNTDERRLENDHLLTYIKQISKVHELERMNSGDKKYREAFLCEKHDRVKTNDRKRVKDAVNANLEILGDGLALKYGSIKIDNDTSDIDEGTKKAVINYCYKKLSVEVRNHCGISNGHHWEEYPPVTMWAEESVIADELLKQLISDKKNKSNTEIYRNTMSKVYTSKSWPSVSVSENCNLNKLRVINKCKLNEISSQNCQEVIYNAYNLALLKLGEYKIYKMIIELLNLNEDPINWM